MGFLDSKKKTTNTNTTNDYTTTTTDNRYVEQDLGDGAIGISGDVGGTLNLSTSDMGAIAAGQDIALRALDYGADSLELGFGAVGEGYDFGRDLLSATVDSLNGTARDFAQLTQRSLESTQSAYNSANTSEDGKISQQLLLGLAVVVSLWVLSPVLMKIFKG